jgi:hypothetical protein
MLLPPFLTGDVVNDVGDGAVDDVGGAELV